MLLNKYYQACRSPLRLHYLIDLTWRRLQLDRKRIEKVILEKSSAIFYEGEMLERDLRLCVRKYQHTHSTLDVRHLSVRFADLATKMEKIAAVFPV